VDIETSKARGKKIKQYKAKKNESVYTYMYKQKTENGKRKTEKTTQKIYQTGIHILQPHVLQISHKLQTMKIIYKKTTKCNVSWKHHQDTLLHIRRR